MNYAQTLINELHDTYGLTDRELAERLNCSREYIGAVRNERKAGNNLVPELLDIRGQVNGTRQAPASVSGSSGTSARNEQAPKDTEDEQAVQGGSSFLFYGFVVFFIGAMIYAMFRPEPKQTGPAFNI